MFSLSYLPTAERLTVVIVKTKNLRWFQGREHGGGEDRVTVATTVGVGLEQWARDSRGRGRGMFVKIWFLQNT